MHCGQIQLIIGPMFSGKSTELIRRLRRLLCAKFKCLIVKYSKDDRYDENGIATHDRTTMDAVSCLTPESLAEKAEDFHVIGIDEGQFFPDIVPFAERMASQNKIVIIAALDSTFQRKGFPHILELIPLAERVTKFNSVCMKCFKEGSFNKRITQEMELEVIGGSESYVSVCRSCYYVDNNVVLSS
uniref:Thymidine kinase n=1 Tax=Caligus rogercresseyi TaxID=217165 RepID=C1BR04_CALRO|nr:Thymidine kinase [Caligus rogercresseyi]